MRWNKKNRFECLKTMNKNKKKNYEKIIIKLYYSKFNYLHLEQYLDIDDNLSFIYKLLVSI